MKINKKFNEINEKINEIDEKINEKHLNKDDIKVEEINDI